MFINIFIKIRFFHDSSLLIPYRIITVNSSTSQNDVHYFLYQSGYAERIPQPQAQLAEYDVFYNILWCILNFTTVRGAETTVILMEPRSACHEISLSSATCYLPTGITQGIIRVSTRVTSVSPRVHGLLSHAPTTEKRLGDSQLQSRLSSQEAILKYRSSLNTYL